MPKAGDLVLAKIIATRRQKHLALANGHKSPLHKDEYVILCYGNRYAPEQYEAHVPERLEPCQIVSVDGIAAKLHSWQRPANSAAEIKPFGLVGDEFGRPLNINDWTGKSNAQKNQLPFTIAVIGMDANSGQTTTSAQLLAGLTRAGLQVGAAKVTASPLQHDNAPASDYSGNDSRAGYGYPRRSPSTRKQQQLGVMLDTLISELCTRDVEAIILEISDCLDGAPESLLASQHVSRHLDAIIVSAAGVQKAKAGIDWLLQKKLPVKAVSGTLSNSPLHVEQARKMIDFPVLDRTALSSPHIVAQIDAAGLCPVNLEQCRDAEPSAVEK